MGIPSVLRSSTTVALPQTSNIAAAGGGVGANSHSLGFAVAPQLQSNWCWAAVTDSIARYYDSSSSWTQCKIANTALGRSDCCGSGAADGGKCNKPWRLHEAMALTNNFVGLVPSPMSFSKIQQEVNSGRPVGTRVGWNGGGGHFQAIVGWTVGVSGDEYLHISDPIYLETQILFQEFAGKYQAGGNWNYSYLSQDAVGGGGPQIEPLDFIVSVLSDDETTLGG